MHASNEIPANYFKVGPYIRKHDRRLGLHSQQFLDKKKQLLYIL